MGAVACGVEGGGGLRWGGEVVVWGHRAGGGGGGGRGGGWWGGCCCVSPSLPNASVVGFVVHSEQDTVGDGVGTAWSGEGGGGATCVLILLVLMLLLLMLVLLLLLDLLIHRSSKGWQPALHPDRRAPRTGSTASGGKMQRTFHRLDTTVRAGEREGKMCCPCSRPSQRCGS